MALPLVAALCVPLLAQAETRYVTDRVDIALRSGESPRYKIIRMMPSGTALEVLGVNQNSKYARVRTPEGTVGFVLASEIQSEPVARIRLAELEKRLTELQQAPDALAARLAEIQSAHTDLKERHKALEREKQQLEQDLATIRHASANVLDITNDREHLRLQVAELTRVGADLEQEVRDLKNQTNQRWFLIGAGVLGAGVLAGLVLPHLRIGRRRRSAWGSL